MYEDRIARGMAMLDDHRPGWETEVSLRDLNMADPDHCVLGQVYGNYHVVKYDIYQWSLDAMQDHGFTLYAVATNASEWTVLTEEWKHAITDRIFETYAPCLGNIGEPVRHIELEPLEEPSPVQPSTPTTPSAPAVPAEPSEAPSTQPVPA